jgi:hypothetical protein
MTEFSFDKDQILEGVEIIEVLDKLNTSYDNYLQLKNHGHPQEVEEYKEDVEDLVDELGSGPEESPYDNLIEKLDTAFGASIRFNRADKEEKLNIKEKDEDAYELLVQSCPSKTSLDKPRLLERFKPNSGGLYHITRRVISEGSGYLDRWAEEIEEVEEEQEPATKPGEREDSAERMYR